MSVNSSFFFCISFNSVARVDFFYSVDGKIYVNEINTLPGFTSISMYPQLIGASGINYPTLITRLLELAEEVYNEKQEICLVPDVTLSS